MDGKKGRRLEGEKVGRIALRQAQDFGPFDPDKRDVRCATTGPGHGNFEF